MAPVQGLQALLEQTGWIHALARRLVRDPHLAADLVQDTWIDALEQPPDSSRPVRGWLATVMRNNLSKRRHGESSRARREQDSARAERERSTLEVLEKAEAHRNVVLAVLALDEPYRSTLLMRFFEQLSYHEIARRTGVTRAAVNSRVTRGLQLLRQRLENAYGGDRRALALALLPLAKLPTGVATTLLGVKVMNLVIGTSAVTLLAVTLSVGLSRTSREVEPVVAATPVLAPAEPAGPVLSAPELVQRAPLPSEVQDPGQEHGQDHKKQRRDDANLWKAELFQNLVPAPTVESISVNATSGDVELAESTSGRVEIEARVSAELDRVERAQLTQLFEDHVDVIEEEGQLKIEDKHRDSRGWSIDFVVRVPGKLAVSANSGSGDIVVRTGHVKVGANTGSGDVTVELPQGKIEALQANTGSGDVRVQVGSVAKGLQANTGSGDVAVCVIEAGSPGKVNMNSGSGDVLLVVAPGVSGTFKLETSGDDISLPPALGIAVVRGAGRMHAEGTVGSGTGSYKLASGSGSLRVELGSSLPGKTAR